jgi:hypothetical protein
MTGFSLNTVWEETIAFLRREGNLLVPVALALFGPGQIMFKYGTAGLLSMRGAHAAAGPSTLLIIPAALLILFGNVVISRMVLVPNISVAEALSSGGRQLPRTVGASLLLMAAVMGAALAIIVALTVGSMTFNVDPRNPALSAQISSIVLIPAMLVMIRMMLLVPVAAIEQIGVVSVLRRSWALGAGNFLRFLGVFALLMFLSFVIGLIEQFVVGSVFMLLKQLISDGELLAILQTLINAALEALLSLGVAVYLALVYRKLAMA